MVVVQVELELVLLPFALRRGGVPDNDTPFVPFPNPVAVLLPDNDVANDNARPEKMRLLKWFNSSMAK